jgi:hypothetical protein
MSPRGDQAYLGAIAFAVTAAIGTVNAAIVEFAVLPGVETFPALCAVIGLWFIPIGFAAAASRKPALTVVLSGMAVAFIRLLAVTNPMTYDTAQFYNTAFALAVACVIGALAFRLLPPLSPALRTHRLLVLTLGDLRRLAISPPPWPADWERRIYDRITALPDAAEPLQRGRLLAALSVGGDVDQLRRLVPRLGVETELNIALASFAEGNCTVTIARLHQLDSSLASDPATGPDTENVLRARGRIADMSEALAEHGSYFGSGARA